MRDKGENREAIEAMARAGAAAVREIVGPAPATQAEAERAVVKPENKKPVNSWDHEKDVDRVLACLRRDLLSQDSRSEMEDRPGARFDAAARLAMKVDEHLFMAGASSSETVRLLVLHSLACMRQEWRHSPHPCKRCNAVEVRVRTDDSSDDKTVWCYACDDVYRVDGADS